MKLDRYSRALPVLAMAAAAALLSAQTVPSAGPATAPAGPDKTRLAPPGDATPSSDVQVFVPATQPATQPAPAQTQPSPSAVGPQTRPSALWTKQVALADPPSTQPVEVQVPATTQHAGENPASRPAQKIALKFENAAVNTVLDYLSNAAGFIIIKDGPIDGRISVISREPVTPEEAVAIVNAALKNQGYTAVQQGRFLKIVTIDKALKMNIPVHGGNNPDDIAETDEMITQVIPVKNVDAVKLRTELAQLVSADASLTADQGANALIMTDVSANIKRIVKIIVKLDENTALSAEVRIFHLKFATATLTAKLLTSIFAPEGGQNAQQGGGGRGGPGQMIRQMMMGGGPGGGGGGGAAGGSDSGKTTGKVTATADDRTNTVVVVAPSETLKLIAKIIEELDSDPVAQSTIKTINLKFADATSAAKLVNSVFGTDQQSQNRQQGGGFPFGGPPRLQTTTDTDQNAKVTAAAADKSNTLVVTAPPGVMKLIEDVLEKLDSDPAAMSQVTVFQLKYADADSAAKLINSIFGSDTTSGSSQQNQNRGANFFGGQGGPGGRGGPGGGGQQDSSSSGGKVVVNAVSDERTNTVVVTAPTTAMKVVSAILEKLDSNPSAESALFIYHLKNGVAADIQQTLSNLFSTSTSGSTGNNNNTNRTSGQSLTSSGLGSTSGFGGSSGGRGGSGLGGSGSGIGGSSSSSFGQPLTGNTSARASGANGSSAQAGASVRATSELVGQVIVVADNDTNSLLVSTASKYREQVVKMIEELDRPVPQVLIKVLIAEVTHDRNNDFGPDYSILDTRATGKGLSLAQTLGNVSAQATSGGLAVSLLEDNFSATLHLLSQEGKLDVLSRPYILASDNQAAAITVGQEVPFITNTTISDTGQQINTITYQAVGIILNVTPHINPDGAVTLDVNPEISDISATTVPIGNGINAPVINNRSAQSRVTIRSGNTIVIGGMMQDQKTVTINKVPLLGDIPYLGAAFSRTQTDVSKTELLIFLTPHVAAQPDILPGMSKSEVDGTKILPNAIDHQTYQDQINGLKLGATTQSATSKPSTIDIRPTPSTQPFQGINISGAPEGNPTPGSTGTAK